MTIFNRGINTSYFSNNKHIIGDRNKDIQVFESSYFDCIIDTCAYDGNEDYKTFKYLSNRSDKYVLISSSLLRLSEKKIKFNEKLLKMKKILS